MNKLILVTAIAAVTAITSGHTLAAKRQAGDILLRVGGAMVDPSGVDSDPITLNGGPLTSSDQVKSVDEDTQVGITAAWMVTDKIGLELLAATPFEHDIKVKGETMSALGIEDAGSTKHLPPTLSLQYHPMGGSESDFQPYFGIGVNYTNFFEEDADSELERGLSAVTNVDEKYDLDLDESWGVAFSAGADYFVTDDILINASVWKLNIQTDAEFKGKTTGTKVEADDVDIDPWVWMVGVGYKF